MIRAALALALMITLAPPPVQAASQQNLAQRIERLATWEDRTTRHQTRIDGCRMIAAVVGGPVRLPKPTGTCAQTSNPRFC